MKTKGQNKDATTGRGRILRAPGGPPPTRENRVGLVAASVATVLSMGLLSLTGPAGAAAPAQNGEIAFTSARSGHYEVYLTDAEGVEPAVSVTDGMVGYAPDLSSDGQKIAFTGRVDGREKVFVANTDGSGDPVNVTGTMAGYSPVISPDGKKVAFVSHLDGKQEVYVANADGSEGPVHVTPANGAADYHPVFSPDGERIAYTSRSEKDGDEDVYVTQARLDGGVPTNVSGDDAADDGRPDFSPDGSKVAFVSDRDGNQEIYVAEAAGGEAPVNISNTDQDESSPDFSPDGARVAFSGGWGSSNIFTANVDGSGGLTVVTDEGTGSATDPDYSPDGQRIAFESDWLNQLDVYVANADGSGIPRDITEDGYNLEPDWGGVPDAADTTSPTIVPVSPKSGTTDATPLIRATVRDTPVNPFRSGVLLFVDGERITGLSYDRDSGKLSYESKKLGAGRHRVRVEATDAAGNAASRSWDFAVKKRR